MKYFVSTFILFLFVSILFFSCKNEKRVKLEDKTKISSTKEKLKAAYTEVDSFKYCVNHDTLGVGGYDLLSYHERNKAEKGNEAFQSEYKGIKYQFVNKDHQSKFEEDPIKYLPAFGGWCSMTLAMGRATVPTYDNFRIIEGRLYLFEKTLSINGQTLWMQDPAENKKVAHKNYTSYIEKGEIEN